MTGLFVDGFDHYGNAGQMLGDIGWVTNSWVINTSNPRTGTSCITQSGGSMTFNMGSTATHFIIGFGFYISDLRFQQGLARIYPSAGTGAVPHFSVEINPAGFAQLYRWPTNSAGQTLVATSAGVAAVTGTYQYYEIEFVLSDTVGSCTLWREGVQVVTYSGDTRNNDQTLDCNVWKMFDSNNNDKFIDDWYALIGGDGTAPDARLGPIKARTQLLAADNTLNWTITGGDPTAAAALSHIPQLIASKNIQAAAATNDFLCTVNALPVTVSSIAMVAVMTFQEKSDAGVCEVQVKVKSGGTIGSGNNNSISTGPGYYRDIFPHDPNTSANWTRANFNAALFGATRNT